jgi:hypothetical protein
MKRLILKDLPVLADIIRTAIHRQVEVGKKRLFVRHRGQIITILVMRNGKVFSNCKISGIPMKHCRRSCKFDWEVLI